MKTRALKDVKKSFDFSYKFMITRITIYYSNNFQIKLIINIVVQKKKSPVYNHFLGCKHFNLKVNLRSLASSNNLVEYLKHAKFCCIVTPVKL